MADDLRRQNEKKLGIDDLPHSLFIQDAEKKEDIAIAAEALSKSPAAVEEVAQQSQEAGLISRNTAEEIKKEARHQELPQTITKSELKRDSNVPTSPKENFMSSLALFLPSIIGGLAGGILEGAEGAEAGISGGLRGTKAGLDIVQQVKEIERMDQPDAKDALAVERLQIAKGQLTARQEEIKEGKKRTRNLEEDRKLRREERDLKRAIASKESFGKRADIKKVKDGLAALDSIEDIINKAPEIAVGTIPAKIARGIAGEVGVLTDQDIARAQISPSVWRALKRGRARYLQGRIPEEDRKELSKIVQAMRVATKGRLRKKVEAFSKSRAKNFSETIQKDFKQDLFIEHEIDDPQPVQKRAPAAMTDAQRSRLEELRKKHGRK